MTLENYVFRIDIHSFQESKDETFFSWPTKNMLLLLLMLDLGWYQTWRWCHRSWPLWTGVRL